MIKLDKSTRRAQAGVVSAVVLGGILVAGITSAYMWGLPLLQKNQDTDNLRTTLDQMRELSETIDSISRRGGSQQVSFNVGEGSLAIDTVDDTITYSISTSAAYVSTGGWVPLNEDDMSGIERIDNGTGYGIVGQDEPGVVIGRSRPEGENFRTTYTIAFRELVDLDARRGFKVDLVENGNLQVSGGTHNIVVRKDTDTVEPGASGLNSSLVRRQVLIGVE